MLVAAEKLGGTGHTEVDSKLSQHSRGTMPWKRSESVKKKGQLLLLLKACLKYRQCMTSGKETSKATLLQEV